MQPRYVLCVFYFLLYLSILQQLADMLLRMRREQAVVDEVSSHTASRNPSLLNTISNHIDQFIIIDRNVDLVTPLCTQLTYEGLIDETMGIRHCKLRSVELI